MSLFKPATKTKAKLRLALAGPAGSGKTYTALALATVIADGGRVAVIDTENGSASKYADLFSFDAAGLTVGTGFSPERYLEMLRGAEADGYAVIVMDSLSHEWAGKDGILESVDQAAARVSGNKFVAWGQVTPRHDKLVRAIVESPAHIICTLRAKMEYVQEKNERGRTEIRAVGMKPIQRDELEYEFDVYGLLDQDNRLVIRKSRCPALSGAVVDKPGKETGDVLMAWLNNGAAPVPLAGGIGDSSATDAATGAVGTPAVAGAAPSSDSSTGTSALSEATDQVKAAAVLTGANPKPGNAFICAGCESVVTNNVTILKKKDGPKVTVAVPDFMPVCEERLGAIYCGPCYDERYWKVKAA